MVCSVVERSGCVTIGLRRGGVGARVGVGRLEELVVGVVEVRLVVLAAVGDLLPGTVVPSGMPKPPRAESTA